MKLLYAVATLLCAAHAQAHAQTAAHQSVLRQFQGNVEPTVKDAVWTSPKMFKVGVIDSGQNRDGYAAYVCGEVAASGLKGVSVQVVDIAKLKSTGKWVKLGEKHCG